MVVPGWICLCWHTSHVWLADFIICTCEFEFRQAQQSSRRLERECQRNIELVWLTGRLMPLRADIVEKRSAANGPMHHERPSASRKRGAGNLRAPVQRERPCPMRTVL